MRTLQINKRMTMYSSDNSRDILIVLTWMPLMWSFASDGRYQDLFAWFKKKKKSSKIFFSWNYGIPLQLKPFLYFPSFSTILPFKTNFIKTCTRMFFCWENAVVQHFCRFPLICWRRSLFGILDTKHFGGKISIWLGTWIRRAVFDLWCAGWSHSCKS